MDELHQVSWRHPRREMVEVLCKRHEDEVVSALKTLGLGCSGRKAPGYRACMRCLIEATGEEPRFAYGLVG